MLLQALTNFSATRQPDAGQSRKVYAIVELASTVLKAISANTGIVSRQRIAPLSK